MDKQKHTKTRINTLKNRKQEIGRRQKFEKIGQFSRQTNCINLNYTIQITAPVEASERKLRRKLVLQINNEEISDLAI